MVRSVVLSGVIVVYLMGVNDLAAGEQGGGLLGRLPLREGWLIRSSTQVKEGGAVVSTGKFVPESWHPTSIPSTVLNALVKNGVYPDPCVGLNNFLIPDVSDEFNQKHNLAKYSHLPGELNPWKDPYWYRTEFRLPEAAKGKRAWLNFKGINYRADVWLNGHKIANRQQMAGVFSRYRFDITDCVKTTDCVKAGAMNYLAVKIHQVDHPAVPDAQQEVFCKPRNFRKEIMKDVTLVMSVGYDCMPVVRDRNMGIWQDVYIDFTGPVRISSPFVVTDLPLPKTSPARLTISAELVNTTASRQTGILSGTIVKEGIKFEKPVELASGETKKVVFSGHDAPEPVIDNPRLWWPNNYGEQNLYNLVLSFKAAGKVSDQQNVTFGVREITKVLHELDGEHGLRLHINGKKVFCRGGYIQPEAWYNWDAKRIETEIRYLTQANLNLVYFEDFPNPPEEFADACDRYGLMWGNCYYGCFWAKTGTKHPTDFDLLERGTIDVVKRYRNYPSLILHMAMNEGDTREDVYRMWRSHVIKLDGTRLLVPSGSYPDYRENPQEWIKQDMPVGMNDWIRGKSYGWQKPSQYYRWVRDERGWMFQMECGSASLPPVDSLRRFIPDIWQAAEGPNFPLQKTWAHHGANSYYKPYDAAIRRMHGTPRSVEDYCMKGHLVTADQHRAMFEATRHRMWDITSGLTQWKLNACWPSVQWQIYDYYLKPMVSYYYIKKACEPLHVQLSPPELDQTVTVVNDRFQANDNLAVGARVYDFNMKLRWEKNVRTNVKANSCKEVFAIPDLPDLAPVYFVKLELKDARGKLLSDNFYWFSTSRPADFTALRKLPPVALNLSYSIEPEDENRVVHVKLENPTDRLAFFVHLAATNGPGKEEILPVFWDDNYFSLLPGQSKRVCATIAAADLGDAPIAVEAGGWNIQSPLECVSLKTSKTQVQVDEPFTVTAVVKNTFIDGSNIELRVDGKAVASKRLWAREDAGREADFTLKLREPGLRKIQVGTRTISVRVK